MSKATEMKKDIPQQKVDNFAIAIVPREDINPENKINLWDTFLINLEERTLKNVFINTKGYGKIQGKEVKTTTLRHFFEEIGPSRAIKLEPIQTKLFEITNEYWVSFNYEGHMFDKKYVFVKGSISPINFTNIPIIEKKGIMIQ